MQELPPFSLIFGLLFDFISPFFIATSHFYIAALHRSPTSQSYLTLLRCIAPHLASQPTSHRTLHRIASRLAPSHRHCLVSLHMTCQVLGPSRAARTISG